MLIHVRSAKNYYKTPGARELAHRLKIGDTTGLHTRLNRPSGYNVGELLFSNLLHLLEVCQRHLPSYSTPWKALLPIRFEVCQLA